MKKKPKAPKLPTGSKRTPSLKASTASTASISKWIRIDRPFPLPAYVKEAIQKLDEAGHIAYIVGGSVRDFLLGRETKDHDIATSASPDELCSLFPKAINVGKAFGVIKVPVTGTDKLLEIATFREDLDYRDYRHPRAVRFAGPIEDSSRRDFTVNALFFDPKTSRILDCVGGMKDLQDKILRAIGDPMERFREDALRLLRAVRFTTTLGFTLEQDTAEAVSLRAKLITRVSFERIRDELTSMWVGPRPAEALMLLQKLGLLSFVLPEVESVQGINLSPVQHPEGDVWKHTLRLVSNLAKQNPKRTATMAWAAILYDVGKPVAFRKSGKRNINGHEMEGAKIAEKVCDRLKMSREQSDLITSLVGDQLKFREVFQMREATLLRFLQRPHFDEFLALHRANATATDGNLAFYEFCASRYQALKSAPSMEGGKIIDGNDLIQLGLKPGPEFSSILRTIEDLAIEKKLNSKEEALEYVIKHFVK